MVDSIREELFEYLVSRLVTRPDMVREFAEAVMGIEMKDFIKQLVPVVLPKLVLDQQHSQQALDTLQELANQLKSDLGVLLLEWCHRVLSVLLLRADGMELSAALQFYEAQTEVKVHEIFAAVLPALLDELVRFLGDVDNEDGLRRQVFIQPLLCRCKNPRKIKVFTGGIGSSKRLQPCILSVLEGQCFILLNEALHVVEEHRSDY